MTILLWLLPILDPDLYFCIKNQDKFLYKYSLQSFYFGSKTTEKLINCNINSIPFIFADDKTKNKLLNMYEKIKK